MSDSRRKAFLEQSVRSLAYEREDIATALLAALPEPDRAVARDVVREMQISGDMRQTLLDALRSPHQPEKHPAGR
jgi:hypothetical protein